MCGKKNGKTHASPFSTQNTKTNTHKDEFSNVLDQLMGDWGWADYVMSLALCFGRCQCPLVWRLNTAGVNWTISAIFSFSVFVVFFFSRPDYNKTHLSPNTHPHLWKFAENPSSSSDRDCVDEKMSVEINGIATLTLCSSVIPALPLFLSPNVTLIFFFFCTEAHFSQ